MTLAPPTLSLVSRLGVETVDRTASSLYVSSSELRGGVLERMRETSFVVGVSWKEHVTDRDLVKPSRREEGVTVRWMVSGGGLAVSEAAAGDHQE